MWSSSPVWARPVRTFARSVFSASTVFRIFCSAVFLISAIIARLPSIPCVPSIMQESSLVFAQHDALERRRLENAEDVDRQLLVAAQRQRGGIHHLEILDDGLVEGEALVTHRVGVGLGIVGIDPVHLGTLH